MRAWFAPAAIIAALFAGGREVPSTTGGDARWRAATQRYFESLRPESRAAVAFAFDDPRRLDWHFIPRERKGLALGAMDDVERRSTHALLREFLSPLGYERALGVIELEAELRRIENNPSRDPGRYYASVFGDPGTSSPWTLRIEGHHLALNFTGVAADGVATTPFFLGANPAEVETGDAAGRRLLASLEIRAHSLIHRLSPDQRAAACFSATAPADVLFGPASPLPDLTLGVAVAALSTDEVAELSALVQEVTGHVTAAGSEALPLDARFAWAGALEPGAGHYWRVATPEAVIEYDNTQNNANHVHLLWRDPRNDFAAAWLASHRMTEATDPADGANE
ncbi:MAG: DUF3500 domain-containing protein [Planctomycetes bacterium]|nr:DUF3500 domain-containing protein [Planctomycetota bacterium]